MYEQIELISNYISYTNAEYQCSYCINKHSNKPDEIGLKHRRNKGCEKPVSHVVYQFDDILYKKCPTNLSNESFHYVYMMFQNYQKGILPFTGSYVDQPNKIVETFNLLHNLIKREESKEDSSGKQGSGRTHR